MKHNNHIKGNSVIKKYGIQKADHEIKRTMGNVHKCTLSKAGVLNGTEISESIIH